MQELIYQMETHCRELGYTLSLKFYIFVLNIMVDEVCHIQNIYYCLLHLFDDKMMKVGSDSMHFGFYILFCYFWVVKLITNVLKPFFYIAKLCEYATKNPFCSPKVSEQILFV